MFTGVPTTITPAAGFFIGFECYVTNYSTQLLTLAPTIGETIESRTGGLNIESFATIQLKKVYGDLWMATGELSL